MSKFQLMLVSSNLNNFEFASILDEFLRFGQVTCVLEKLLAFWTSYLHFGQVTSVLVLL